MDREEALPVFFSDRPRDEGRAADLAAAIGDVFEVHPSAGRHDLSADIPLGFFQGTKDTIVIPGRLRAESERAYEVIARRFRARGHIPLLRRAGGEHAIVALPGSLPDAAGRPWVALALFLATVLSVLFVGYDDPPEGLLAHPAAILRGWPFAASLLGILLAHELGHFVVARHLGVPATFPYFIPLPLSLFGTMGAVIRLKAPPKNKRHLLAVAVAGPLAGLAVAIPLLALGLTMSTVQRIPGGLILQEGNSLLYAGLKFLIFGRFLPFGGEDVFLHPVAFAGWAGLLVTGLNLLPAGQLDGGHVAQSLLGDRAKVLTYGVIGALLALSFIWREWLIWAALIFVFGRLRLEPLDDVTSLRPRERAFAVVVFAVFILVFTPIPIVIG